MAAVVDSQGSTVTFNGVTFKATKVTVTYGGGGGSASSTAQIDVSHVGIPSGGMKEYQSPPLGEVVSASGVGVVATITMDWIDLQRPILNVEHPIDLGAKAKIKGGAKCTEYTVDLAVNDIIRGSAKFDLVSEAATYP
jgi:hypothetical protein